MLSEPRAARRLFLKRPLTRGGPRIEILKQLLGASQDAKRPGSGPHPAPRPGRGAAAPRRATTPYRTERSGDRALRCAQFRVPASAPARELPRELRQLDAVAERVAAHEARATHDLLCVADIDAGGLEARAELVEAAVDAEAEML